MSKPMLVTLPFVLLLLDYWPLNRTAINTQNEKNVQVTPLQKAPSSRWGLDAFCQSRDVAFWKGASGSCQRGSTLKTGKEKLSLLILEKIPLFILSAISICITIQLPRLSQFTQSAGTIHNFFIGRINNAIFSYAMYLKKLFWPMDLFYFLFVF